MSFRMRIDDAFAFEDGRTVFVGIVTTSRGYVAPLRCDLIVDGQVIQQLTLEGEMLPAKRVASAERSVSTVERVVVAPRSLGGRSELVSADADDDGHRVPL